MLSFKRLRVSSSEEKTGEMDKQELQNESATPTSDSDTEVRTVNTESILHNILAKVSVLDDMCKKVDVISEKVVKIEANLVNIDTRLSDLEHGTEFLELEVSEIKQNVSEIREMKANLQYVNELKKNVVDLVNRSKQNNVILHGVPEGEEISADGTQDCVTYARNFFVNHMNMHDKVEIERAHRTPRVKRPTAANGGSSDRPRPIHVKLLRFTDREAILKRSSTLKGKTIRGSKIGISDDVHKDTRMEHKQLMVKVRKMREENKFAFIPNTVPRVIKYKDGPKDTPGPLKTLRLSDINKK